MQSISKQFYLWTRKLHLYFGLAMSPFVLLFAISVILLNHPWMPLGGSDQVGQATVSVQIPPGLEHLEGRARVDEVQKIMRQLGLSGEISFISFRAKENCLVVPISKPGQATTLELYLQTNMATIQERKTGIGDALNYLHKSPGPHNAAVRGNWVYTGIWRWFADAVVYLLLFISASGIYLWVVLKAERKIGFILIGAGAISFMGVIYALCV